MNAVFDKCARQGCGHARWNHQAGGPCRAGPDDYECECPTFTEEEGAAKEIIAEALAIAAEETPLEKKLRADLREKDDERRTEAERGEALRVRLRELRDHWYHRYEEGGPAVLADCARELREAADEEGR